MIFQPNRKINGTLQIVSGLAFVWALFQGFAWYWWLAALVFHFYYYVIGVSAGYHRYYTHQSFKTPKWAEYLMMFGGLVGGYTSPTVYAAVHIKHHKNSDKKGDPHSPKDHGLKLLFLGAFPEFKLTKREFLQFTRNKEAFFMHKYFLLIVLAWAATLFLIDWKVGLFFWLIPYFFTTIGGTSLLTLAHKYGYRNFDTDEGSTNVWWMVPVIWGEAWHNNHHRYPGKWSNKVKWWEIDPAAWFIRMVKK